jgi:hypothetical protein
MTESLRVSLSPDTERRAQLGELHGRFTQRYDEAMQWYRRAAELDPGRADGFFYLGTPSSDTGAAAAVRAGLTAVAEQGSSTGCCSGTQRRCRGCSRPRA